MIELSDVAKSILARGSYKYYVRAESWLGDDLLADSVPIASGGEEVDRSLGVPERITLTVPRIYNGFSWSPVTDGHPLAANGQRLKVELGIGVGLDVIEWFQRGWFVIREAETQGDTVTVAAEGLLTWIEEARLISPLLLSGTYKSSLRDLIEPALTVVFDSDLEDRSVPSGLNFDQDRIGAVLNLLNTWPAVARVTEDGYYLVEPDEDDLTPVLTLTNGSGGTVITSTGTSTREDAFNCVVAEGTAPDGGVVRGVAYDNAGPKKFGGDFNPLAVPYYYDSPLLHTTASCIKAARTILRSIKRKTSKAFEVEMVPYPALQAGDLISLTTDDYTDLLCTVEQLSLPYTPGGGAQRLVVRSLS